MRDRTWFYLAAAVAAYAAAAVVLVLLIGGGNEPVCWERSHQPGVTSCLDPANDDRR